LNIQFTSVTDCFYKHVYQYIFVKLYIISHMLKAGLYDHPFRSYGFIAVSGHVQVVGKSGAHSCSFYSH